MRRPDALVILVLAACGGGGGNGDGGGGDGTPNPDGNNLPDAAQATCTPKSGTDVTMRLVTTVTEEFPLVVTAPVGDARLFVVERDGTIRILRDEQIVDPPFLDISGPVASGGEMGLLGLAFHPQYATNRKFYVMYTTSDANVIAEYTTMATNPDRGDEASARIVLSIPDFAGNHNGGMIEFGNDGFLYIGTGDGGNANDPEENGQNPNRLLAKMLRIDVDNPAGGREYGIPAGNPYAAGGGAPEVYMIGLRNPWRWSFDRANGNIYIGDVGQGAVEEVDVIEPSGAAGADLGWDDCEGSSDFEAGGCGSPTQPNRRRPVYEQSHGAGWTAVIGGQVYRGSCYPDLVGRYFFTDYNAGGLHSFVYAGGQATDVIDHPGSFQSHPGSLHADALGELYITYENGRIYHIEVQ